MIVINKDYVSIDGKTFCVNCLEGEHKNCIIGKTINDEHFECLCDCVTNKIPDEKELRTTLLLSLQNTIEKFEKSAYSCEADALKAIAKRFVESYY